MFSRLPLPFKILLWFFVNVALLVAVCLLLFNAEYHFNLDWLFASNARQRVDAMRELLVSDLNAQPPDDWEDVIERFADAYHVRFALYDDQSRYLLGPVEELPAEVRTQMRLWTHPSGALRRGGGSPSPASARRQAQKTLVRTTEPTTRYWLLFTAQVDNPQAGGTMHLNVVADSSSASMGGLIIDPTPWLKLAVGAIICSVLFWLPLLRGVTRAIGQVTHAARQIAEGRFDTRVSTRRRDELGVLAAAINQMAVRLDGLLKGQKRFLGDVAHELCSPLARLQMTLGIMEQRAGDDRQRQYARTASEKAAQIAALVDQLLAFSRASLGGSGVRLQAVDARAAALAAVRQETGGEAAAAGGATAAAGAVRVEVPEGLTVQADPELLGRALGNLLRNALRYGAGAGPVVVRAGREPGGAAGGGAADGVKLTVADTGPGVPEEELPKIFDAFYRVDTSRTRETGGVGLGLSIVKMCVEACGGTVVAHNQPEGGLEVSLRLPAASAAS